MDVDVHGFASDNTPPINVMAKESLEYLPNGSNPAAFEGSASLSQRKHHH